MAIRGLELQLDFTFCLTLAHLMTGKALMIKHRIVNVVNIYYRAILETNEYCSISARVVDGSHGIDSLSTDY